MRETLERTSPVTGEVIWTGQTSHREQIDAALEAAKRAFPVWMKTPVEERIACLNSFAAYLQVHRDEVARTITLETGKPLWESDLEVSSSIAKVDLAVDAYRKRRDTTTVSNATGTAEILYRPIGPVLVLGPFNLPLHLPGAHIIPALLAGNTAVFKPSEKTPGVGDCIARAWQNAGLPEGTLSVLQGGPQVAVAAMESTVLGGVLFTGSLNAGLAIHRRFAGRPDVLLALEMGGNNGLVVDRIHEIQAAVEIILQSAFITSGQRCTCARRLILIESDANRELLASLARAIARVRVSDPLGQPAPFMGTLIDPLAARMVLEKQEACIQRGMQPLCISEKRNGLGTQLSPSLLLDPDGIADDEEIFGPMLIASFVPDLESAIDRVNTSRFGLSAGLLSDDASAFRTFQQRIRAGIINWNHPTTGATGTLPFGGLGLSGNHRSSGYFAADYCSDPVASLQRPSVVRSNPPLVGMEGLWTT